MQLIPLKTQMIKKGDDLVSELLDATNSEIEDGDILIISSKAVATAEGRIVDLSKLEPSDKAKTLAQKCDRTPEFCQAVLEEVEIRNGEVVGTCPGAIVTELRPWNLSYASRRHRLRHPEEEGAEHPTSRRVGPMPPQRDVTMGTIITANAGLDESNTEKGTAIGWPEDPVESAWKIRKAIEQNIAVIISDSCLRPRRWGVTAFALTASGIDPLSDKAGANDLFGKPLHITKEATADQLATSANMLMGNADQSIPAVIIRNHGLALSDFEGWVPGVEPEEDLFRGIV